MLDASGKNRRCTGDAGAAVVEAAFILPVFLYFVFGILELGLLFKSYLTLGNLSASGVRSLAIYGKDVYADRDALLDMQRNGGAIPAGDVTRIVIYNAGKDGRTGITAGCASGTPQAGVCNVFSFDQLTALPVETAWNCGYASPYELTSPSSYWCPAPNARNNPGRTDAQSGPNRADYVGLQVVFRHRWVTGLFGGAITLTENNLARIEPVTVY